LSFKYKTYAYEIFVCHHRYALTAFSLSGGPLPIGSPVPKADIKMKDISGQLVSLKEAKGNNGLL